MDQRKPWHGDNRMPESLTSNEATVVKRYYVPTKQVMDRDAEMPWPGTRVVVLASDYDRLTARNAELEEMIAAERIAFWEKDSDQRKAIENREARLSASAARNAELVKALERIAAHPVGQLSMIARAALKGDATP